MATIYDDGAGNKYIGDCKWGAHDINYPTTFYTKFETNSTLLGIFNDFKSILQASNYNNIYTPSVTPTDGSAVDIYRFSLPGETNAARGYVRRQNGSNYNWWDTETANNGTLTGILYGGWGGVVGHYQYEQAVPSNVIYLNYAICSGQNSFAYVQHSPVPWQNKSFTDFEFTYYGRLVDINPTQNYYSGSYLNHTVLFNYRLQPLYNNLLNFNTSQLTGDSNSYRKYNHFIAGATKALLETGRAAEAFVCVDGQVPSASAWVSEMWVFDNNATLGYPAIGRVPNMLLGTGTYTYLKPVRIVGEAQVKDGGSPWYLPVGTYAGKTLLMRCYSSM